MSQRLQSSGQTILDTVQWNFWSFSPLWGKFLRFYLVCTCSSCSLEPHDLLRSSFPKVTTVTVMNWLGEFFLHTLVKWDTGTLYLSIYSMLCFVLFFIATFQITLKIGNLSKVASMLLAPFFGKSTFVFIIHIAAMCWDLSYKYMGLLSLSLLIADTASRVVFDFILV